MAQLAGSVSVTSNTTWTSLIEPGTRNGGLSFITVKNAATSDQSVLVRCNLWIRADGTRDTLTLAAGDSVTIGSPGANGGYITTVEAQAAASPSSTAVLVAAEATLA